MSSRFGDSRESRWSSERERQEQEARRKAFEEQPPRRRRRASWREGSAGAREDAVHGPDIPPQEEQASPIRPHREPEPAPRAATVGRKWRDSVDYEADDADALPDLPGDGDGGDGRGGSRVGKGLLIFGALLFMTMAALAFLPFGPLGDDDEATPTPTVPVAVVPTAPEQDPNRGNGETADGPRLADSEMVVCVDPGHGGWDTGRQRQAGEYPQPWFDEAEINLAMAFMLREELESRGVRVVMTRETGTAVNVFGEDVNGDGRTILDSAQDGDRDELQARINICNASEADLLVSLHLNGFDDPAIRGYEVLYTPAPTRDFGNQNLDLATVIYRQIGAAYREVGFETDPRGTVSDETLDAETHEFGSERNLVLTGPAVNNPDYTIVPSQMPGVFIEPVFISNQDDANFIVLPENQRLLAASYAEGIMDYFDQYPG